MTLLLPNYAYHLIFTLNTDTPPGYQHLWDKLKYKCQNGNVDNGILEMVKDYCKLPSNQSLIISNLSKEGSFNDTSINKQIKSIDRICYNNNNNDQIELWNIININKELWTMEQLDDLVEAFVATFNELTDHWLDITGYIGLKKH